MSFYMVILNYNDETIQKWNNPSRANHNHIIYVPYKTNNNYNKVKCMQYECH